MNEQSCWFWTHHWAQICSYLFQATLVHMLVVVGLGTVCGEALAAGWRPLLSQPLQSAVSSLDPCRITATGSQRVGRFREPHPSLCYKYNNVRAEPSQTTTHNQSNSPTLPSAHRFLDRQALQRQSLTFANMDNVRLRICHGHQFHPMSTMPPLKPRCLNSR